MSRASEPRAALPLLTLRNAVLFPGATLTVELGRKPSIDAIEWAQESRDPDAGASKHVLVVTQRDAMSEQPRRDDLFDVGTVARILEHTPGIPGRATVVLRGLRRVNLLELQASDRAARAQEGSYSEREEDRSEAALCQALAGSVRELGRSIVNYYEEVDQDEAPDQDGPSFELLEDATDPATVADLAVSLLDGTVDEQMSYLRERQIKERLRRVIEALTHTIKTLEVRIDINKTVREHMKAHEHRVMLKHRARAIEAELGSADEEDEDWLDELHGRLEEKKLPEAAMYAAHRELNRLEQLNPHSSEADIARNYVEWLLDLPWTCELEAQPAPISLAQAKEVMNQAHYGLEKPKKRVLEYLAVRQLAPQRAGPILCLAGPPGVGKTSLATSIAKALDRPLVRVALGGLRDAAEIRGHRRAYVGAQPGKILAAMKRAKSASCVVLLDEIDKIAHDEARGDPTAALLETLDPEQNAEFEDHYLNVPYDLSQVVFLCTANDLAPIAPYLRDRLEILQLSGYTQEDKIEIGKAHLLPLAIKEHGLSDHPVTLDEQAWRSLTSAYTREAGVRGLARSLAALMRDRAMRLSEGKSLSDRIDAAYCTEVLGPPRFHPELRGDRARPGVVTGLAWTPSGGRILFLEAASTPGEGRLRLTGQQGDTMRESARTAHSLVRSSLHRWGFEEIDPQCIDLHIHIPAGAVRKDGPSAGAAMTLAVLSRLRGRDVPADLAITGEVTLTGQILAVGGIREKVLAAHRAGIRRVVLPERNRKDEAEIPSAARQELEIHYIRRIEELFALAWEGEVGKQRLAETRATCA